MHCTLVYRLYIMARLKWQQKCANAADRGDRVESVYTRVYSIIYRCSISMQFVGVQVFLLRVNRACKTNTSVTVHHNLDEPLETAVVELSGLPVAHCSSLTGLLESWSVACSSACSSVTRASRVCLFVCLFVCCWSGCSSVTRASRVCLFVRLIAPAPLVFLLDHLLES